MIFDPVPYDVLLTFDPIPYDVLLTFNPIPYDVLLTRRQAIKQTILFFFVRLSFQSREQTIYGY